MNKLQNDFVLTYIALLRLDKPIGILLLLWPTLWALWLAANGNPPTKILLIFIFGVILMRSAGCVFNDIADRNFDSRVKRTRERPLATGELSIFLALSMALFLVLLAFCLVLMCNRLTIELAFVGVLLAIFYPFMKRFTHLPQLGLGLAFAWGVPMSFAAVQGQVNFNAWILFLTAMIWPVIYDTCYAMVDKEDDVKIGIKSTAILFANYDRLIIGLLQFVFLMMLIYVGLLFQLQSVYYWLLFIVLGLSLYQQYLLKNRDRDNCFAAFLNHHWIGLIVFTGIFFSLLY